MLGVGVCPNFRSLETGMAERGPSPGWGLMAGLVLSLPSMSYVLTQPCIPHLASLTAPILCLSCGSAKGPGQWCPGSGPGLMAVPHWPYLCTPLPPTHMGQADQSPHLDTPGLLLRDSWVLAYLHTSCDAVLTTTLDFELLGSLERLFFPLN